MLDITEANNLVQKLNGVSQERKKVLSKLDSEIKALNDEIAIYDTSLSVIRRAILSQGKSKEYIENIISSALNDIFGSEMGGFVFQFEEIFDTLGNLKGLKPRLKEREGEFDSLHDSFGMAVQYISSICLKIGALVLTSDTEKILILDEPLANVDEILQLNFSKFLFNIAEKLDFQIILTSLSNNTLGTKYTVSKEKGFSKVKKND